MSDYDGECCDCCHYGGYGKLAALEAERDALKAEVEYLRQCNTEVADDRLCLRAQLKVAKEALEKITKNKCECWKDSGPVNCSCGLEFQDIAKHALSQLEGK